LLLHSRELISDRVPINADKCRSNLFQDAKAWNVPSHDSSFHGLPLITSINNHTCHKGRGHLRQVRIRENLRLLPLLDLSKELLSVAHNGAS
jgi:hypothetical protein